jgi:signal peptidase I
MTTLSFDATDGLGAEVRPVTRMDRRSSAKRWSRKSRLARCSVNVLLVGVCTLTGLSTIGNLAGWWRTDTVLSGSMRPGMQPGDVEILRPEATSALRVGQVVAFHPTNQSFVVSHRVVALRIGSGRDRGVWITTKGDANNTADPWGSIRVLSPKVWVVSGVVPYVGFLSVWVREPLPHLLELLTIVLLACTLALEAIWRT